MCQVAVKIPDAVLYDTHMTSVQAAEFVRKAIALDYYTRLHVSIGYCAQIAELPEEEFIQYLGAHSVSLFQFDSAAEFMEEAANA